jgi:hypothetical protein
MADTIRVLEGYRGRPSNEQFIPAGDYPANDPALHGAGAYLLESGFAVSLSEKPKPAASKKEDKPEPDDE